MGKQADPATVDGSLRLGGGVDEAERLVAANDGHLSKAVDACRSTGGGA